MADKSPESKEPTNKPAPDAKLERWGYFMKLQFHPEIRLDKKRGFEFAQQLVPFFDAQSSELKADRWVFKQPLGTSPDCFLSIIVSQKELQMHGSNPMSKTEIYETKYKKLLEVFEEFFKPEMILSSSAMVNGSLRIDGDARLFLAQHVMKIDPARNDAFGRPIHLVGIRFFFPPFRKKGAKKKEKNDIVEWQVDVKAESFIEDPTLLFLEADADWVKPRPWDSEAVEEEIQRLGIVSGYLETNVLAFLQHESDPPIDTSSEESE